jgi:putative transcriptional regulator
MSDHVVEELYGYTAGHLAAPEVSRVEEHLRHCAECRKEADELDQLGETLSVSPSNVLQSLQGQLSGAGRFEHFVARVATFFDISEEQAREELKRLDDSSTWEQELAPGIWVAPVNAGPKAMGDGAFTVLLKIAPGAVFPKHTHTAEEQTFLLEGGYLDSGGTEFWRGELDVRQEGSSHSYTGLAGVGCLAVARTYPHLMEGD